MASWAKGSALIIGAVLIIAIAKGGSAPSDPANSQVRSTVVPRGDSVSPGAGNTSGFYTPGETQPKSQSERRQEALSRTEFKVMGWKRGGFGTVLIGDFLFINNNAFPVKDMVVSCMVYGGSGTSLGTVDGTIYETVPAKGRKRMREFNMGRVHTQASSAMCTLDTLNI